MILAAHQPQYMLYPGVIDKIDQADIFVFSDTLQYTRHEWQNRNRLRSPTSEGWVWLTIPVHARNNARICDVFPAKRWVDKHRKTVETLYGRSPYLSRLSTFWTIAKEFELKSLAEINYNTTMEIVRQFGISTKIVRQSELRLDDDVGPDTRLISICRILGCDTYLSGVGGKNYMNLQVWQESGIAVNWQNFELQEYRQFVPGWVANLSIVDLLLSVDDPMNHIRRSRKS